MEGKVDMKVTDLKKELEKRGLSKSGNKAQLLERLEKSLESGGVSLAHIAAEYSKGTSVSCDDIGRWMPTKTPVATSPVSANVIVASESRDMSPLPIPQEASSGGGGINTNERHHGGGENSTNQHHEKNGGCTYVAATSAEFQSDHVATAGDDVAAEPSTVGIVEAVHVDEMLITTEEDDFMSGTTPVTTVSETKQRSSPRKESSHKDHHHSRSSGNNENNAPTAKQEIVSQKQPVAAQAFESLEITVDTRLDNKNDYELEDEISPRKRTVVAIGGDSETAATAPSLSSNIRRPALERLGEHRRPSNDSSSLRRPSNSSTAAATPILEEPMRLRPVKSTDTAPSNIIHILGLKRPLTNPQLMEILDRFAKLDTSATVFGWVDKVRSQCFALYETVEDATKVREALDGTAYPPSNKAILDVDFTTLERMLSTTKSKEGQKNFGINSREEITATASSGSAAVFRPPQREQKPSRGSSLTNNDDTEQTKIDPAEVSSKREARLHRFGGDDPSDEKYQQDIMMRKRLVEKLSAPQILAGTEGTVAKATEIEAKKRKGNLTVDELFRKTKAAPPVYWLPLTKEQIAARKLKKVEQQEKEKEKRRVNGDSNRSVEVNRVAIVERPLKKEEEALVGRRRFQDCEVAEKAAPKNGEPASRKERSRSPPAKERRKESSPPPRPAMVANKSTTSLKPLEPAVEERRAEKEKEKVAVEAPRERDRKASGDKTVQSSRDRDARDDRDRRRISRSPDHQTSNAATIGKSDQKPSASAQSAAPPSTFEEAVKRQKEQKDERRPGGEAKTSHPPPAASTNRDDSRRNDRDLDSRDRRGGGRDDRIDLSRRDDFDRRRDPPPRSNDDRRRVDDRRDRDRDVRDIRRDDRGGDRRRSRSPDQRRPADTSSSRALATRVPPTVSATQPSAPQLAGRRRSASQSSASSSSSTTSSSSSSTSSSSTSSGSSTSSTSTASSSGSKTKPSQPQQQQQRRV